MKAPASPKTRSILTKIQEFSPGKRPRTGPARTATLLHRTNRLFVRIAPAFCLRPAEMLAAVQGDHLARHCRRRKNELHRLANLLRGRVASERNTLPLLAEMGFALPGTWQGRPRPDAI